MISYIGGKSKISKFIIPFIPNDIETYVEVFGGMFWVFYNMKLEDYPNLKRIVYNDFNKLNVNVFNCIKDYEKFSSIITEYPSQKEELFYKFQKELFSGDFEMDLTKPDYHIASKYIYLLTQVWSGTNPEKGKFINLKGKYKSKFDTFKGKLDNPKWQKYFDKIDIVENLDFETNIKKYDSKKTYFYCDPPYLHVTRGDTKAYGFEMDITQHRAFAQAVNQCKGKVAVSGYDHPIMAELFPAPKWNKILGPVKTIHSTKSTRREVLWTNYKQKEKETFF